MSGGVSLLLCRDADAPPVWTETWIRAYPQAYAADCRDGAAGRDAAAAAFGQTDGERVFAVCQGAGVAAFLLWYYGASYADRQRICGMILVPSAMLCGDGVTAVLLRRVRCTAPCALVADGGEDWAADYARCWGARLLEVPPQHSPVRSGGTWEWGMRLMQEMLLAE